MYIFWLLSPVSTHKVVSFFFGKFYWCSRHIQKGVYNASIYTAHWNFTKIILHLYNHHSDNTTLPGLPKAPTCTFWSLSHHPGFQNTGLSLTVFKIYMSINGIKQYVIFSVVSFFSMTVCYPLYGHIIIHLNNSLQMVFRFIICYHKKYYNKFFINNFKIVPVYQGCFLAMSNMTTKYKVPKQ